MSPSKMSQQRSAELSIVYIFYAYILVLIWRPNALMDLCASYIIVIAVIDRRSYVNPTPRSRRAGDAPTTSSISVSLSGTLKILSLLTNSSIIR